MMHFSIAERLRPFSHAPGVSTLLSGSNFQVQIFPCLIRIFGLEKRDPQLLTEISLALQGPIKQFTVINDLEKGRISISGMTEGGWIRYHVISGASFGNHCIRLFFERTPSSGVCIEWGNQSIVLKEKELVHLFCDSDISFIPYVVPHCERLSFGNHKAQDWELIKRRFSLAEIFPLIHRLGQCVPFNKVDHPAVGTMALLEECRRNSLERSPEKGEELWKQFILGAFHSLLVPRFNDDDFQGLLPQNLILPENLSPLLLLLEASQLISRHFISPSAGHLRILPHLLPSLHCGRLLDVQLEGGGKLSIEWSKKTVRRCALHVGREEELYFDFPSHVQTYRLRQGEKDKGERMRNGDRLICQKGHSYFFDNFM